MNSKQWSRPVDGDCAARRAGGRRRHNADAQQVMWDRRFRILEMIVAAGREIPRGAQRQMAEAFKVSPATICQDLEAVSKLYKPKLGDRRAGVKIERHDRRLVIIESAHPVRFTFPPDRVPMMEPVRFIQEDTPGVMKERITRTIWRGAKGEPRCIREFHEVIEKNLWPKPNWRADAWFLERRCPELWGRPSRRRRQASTASIKPPQIGPELEAIFRKVYGDKDDPEPTPNN